MPATAVPMGGLSGLRVGIIITEVVAGDDNVVGSESDHRTRGDLVDPRPITAR